MAKTPYWVRKTEPDGTQTLWCVNTGEARAREIYEREVRRAEEGDVVEIGEGEGVVEVREDEEGE